MPDRSVVVTKLWPLERAGSLKVEDVVLRVAREPEVPDPLVGKAEGHRLGLALQRSLEQGGDEVALEDEEDDQRRREDQQ